ncbi:tyrosine-type recombinase/integrase [Nocardioides daphniae]
MPWPTTSLRWRSPVANRKRSNGEGSIYQRKDGRWVGELYVNQSDGRRVRRQVYGKTRKEAETKLADLRSKSDNGVPIPSTQLTLERFLGEWLEQIVAPRVRPNTLSHYAFHIDKYLVPDLGTRQLGKLTAREVRLYLDSLGRAGRGVRTIRYVHATLRAALEDAVREELIEKNVAKLVRPPSAPRAERQPLTVDEVKVLFRQSRDNRLHALLVVIALLGLRRSEALGLRWEDVDLEAGTLTVNQGLHRVDGKLQVMPTKTARSRRTLPLPDVVAEVLRDHRDHQEKERVDLAERWPSSGFVFTTPIGTPIDPDNCSKFVQASLKAAGVRKVRMHDFRHGCVSVLLALGVPPRIVMEIAGHSALEMTMNVYAHVSLDDKRDALNKLGGLFGEEAPEDTE